MTSKTCRAARSNAALWPPMEQTQCATTPWKSIATRWTTILTIATAWSTARTSTTRAWTSRRSPSPLWVWLTRCALRRAFAGTCSVRLSPTLAPARHTANFTTRAPAARWLSTAVCGIPAKCDAFASTTVHASSSTRRPTRSPSAPRRSRRRTATRTTSLASGWRRAAAHGTAPPASCDAARWRMCYPAKDRACLAATGTSS